MVDGDAETVLLVCADEIDVVDRTVVLIGLIVLGSDVNSLLVVVLIGADVEEDTLSVVLSLLVEKVVSSSAVD